MPQWIEWLITFIHNTVSIFWWLLLARSFQSSQTLSTYSNVNKAPLCCQWNSKSASRPEHTPHSDLLTNIKTHLLVSVVDTTLTLLYQRAAQMKARANFSHMFASLHMTMKLHVCCIMNLKISIKQGSLFPVQMEKNIQRKWKWVENTTDKP